VAEQHVLISAVCFVCSVISVSMDMSQNIFLIGFYFWIASPIVLFYRQLDGELAAAQAV
jgi:hypothetical protein